MPSLRRQGRSQPEEGNHRPRTVPPVGRGHAHAVPKVRRKRRSPSALSTGRGIVGTMLPDELADLKAKLIEHMRASDLRTVGKTFARNRYIDEANFVVGLFKLDRKPKLEFPLLFVDFESTGLLESAKPIQVAGVVVGKDLSKLDIVPSFQPAYIDCLDDRDVMSPEYWLAQNVHHKTLRLIAKTGYPPEDIVAEFDAVHKKYPGLLLAGQNVGFDKRM